MRRRVAEGGVWGHPEGREGRVEGMGVAQSSFVGDASTQGSKANGATGGRCGAIAAAQRWDEGWKASPQCVSINDTHRKEGRVNFPWQDSKGGAECADGASSKLVARVGNASHEES